MIRILQQILHLYRFCKFPSKKPIVSLKNSNFQSFEQPYCPSRILRKLFLRYGQNCRTSDTFRYRTTSMDQNVRRNVRIQRLETIVLLPFLVGEINQWGRENERVNRNNQQDDGRVALAYYSLNYKLFNQNLQKLKKGEDRIETNFRKNLTKINSTTDFYNSWQYRFIGAPKNSTKPEAFFFITFWEFKLSCVHFCHFQPLRVPMQETFFRNCLSSNPRLLIHS